MEAMDAYIHDTVSRFRGNVVRWDVINEQLGADKDKGSDGLRRTFYLDKLGRDYMKHAYATARAAELFRAPALDRVGGPVAMSSARRLAT